MTDFALTFKITITFQMPRNEIGPLVEFSHPIVQSHDFFKALGGIYSANVFPSPLIRMNPFSHKSKTTSSERKLLFFCDFKGFSFEVCRFHYLFLM